MVVYCIKNTVNGKLYFGQTSSQLRVRWNHHVYTARHRKRTSKLHNALRKYGDESFVVFEIFHTESKEELDSREKFLIEFYKTTDDKYGYNITEGGEGANKKMSDNNARHWLGKTQSEESKEKRRKMSSKDYVVTFPDGSVKMVNNLLDFCDVHNLNYRNAMGVLSGRCSQHKGFRFSKVVS